MDDLRYLRSLPALTLAEQRRRLAETAGRSFVDRDAGRGGAVRGGPGDGPGAGWMRLLDAIASAPATAGGGEEARPTVWIASLEVLGDGVGRQAAHWAVLHGMGARVRLTPVDGPVDGAAARQGAAAGQGAAEAGATLDRRFVSAWAERPHADRRPERVRQAMRDRALRGEALGRPPFGYRVLDHRLTPDATEAAVVREIFRLAAEERMGTRRIARRLEAMGERTRRGGSWSAASIGGVLRNPVYEGTYRRRGVVIPRAHEPLVARARFREVQALLDGRRVGGGEQRTAHRYLFGGLVHCRACGGAMVGSRRPNRGRADAAAVIAYRCEANVNAGRCAPGTQRETALTAAVLAALAAGEADGAEREADRAGRGAPPAAAGSGDPVPRGGASGDAVAAPPLGAGFERRVARLLSLAAGGRLTAAQLRARLATEGRREGARLLGEWSAARAEASAARLSAAAAGRRLRERWERLPEPERRALLRRAVRAVHVSDDAVDVVLA